MSRTLILGTLFVGLLMNSAWAQSNDERPTGGRRTRAGPKLRFSGIIPAQAAKIVHLLARHQAEQAERVEQAERAQRAEQAE